MAFNVGTAIGYLELDTSNFRNGMAAAGSEISNFASSGSLQSLGNALQNTGTTLTKNVTLPLAGIGAVAANASMDFEAQMSKVKAISGATGDDFQKLRDQAIQLGADTNFSASEAANGMENLASAGFKNTEIMAAMPGMLDLAAAGGVSIADSSDIASSALRGFGMEASDVTHVADVLAKVAGDTNAGINDTGEAMKYIAPVAHALGISFEDTSAAIGLLSNAGIKGSQAGTTLRASLSNLAAPTKAAKKTMAELGMEFFDSEGKMKPMADIVGILKEKTAGLTQQQKASTMETLFGKEAMSGMLALVDQGPEKLDELTKGLQSCDGASKEMAGVMQDNLKGSIEAMKGSLETAAIKIGDVLAPMIKDCAGWIAELVNSFSALPKETQESIVKFGLIAAAIGPVLIIVAKLIESVRTVMSVFSGIKTAVSVFQALPALMNPYMILIIGIIAAIAAAVYLIYKNWDALSSYFSNLWEWIKNIFSGFWEWLKSFFAEWGPTILAIMFPFLAIPIKIWEHWGQIKIWFTELYEHVASICESIGNWFSDAINKWIGIWDGFKTFMSDLGTSMWEGLIGGLEKGWDWVYEKVTNMAEGVKTLFKKIFDINSPSKVFRGYGVNMGEGLVEGVDQHEPKVRDRFTGLANTITGVISNVRAKVNLNELSLNGPAVKSNQKSIRGSDGLIFEPKIIMHVNVADTGNKGAEQLTSEIKGMAKSSLKDGLVDGFLSDAFRL